MKDLRRSWHCRRMFFRYLRQRDKEKQRTVTTMNNNQQIDSNDTTEKKGLSLFTKIMLLIGLALLIAIIVSICVGQSALNSKPVDWEKSDAAFICLKTFGGLLISWIIIFPIIQFIRGYMAGQKEIEKEQEKQAFIDNLNRQEQIRLNEEKEKQKQYLIQNYDKIIRLADKHSESVFNYLENVQSKAPVFMGIVDKIGDAPSPNLLISKYWDSASLLLKKIFEYDGFYERNYNEMLSHTEMEAINGVVEAQNLTDYFIKGLKKRIIDNADWNDNHTLPCVIYLIIRNNTIQYYHDMYVREIGWENTEQLCLNETKEYIMETDGILMFYVFYKLHETDIKLPFASTSYKIRNEIQQQFETQAQNELENSLFGKQKEPTDDDLPEEFRLENLPMKPIEKVDVMTGEEFEHYMEKYFIKKGYKVTRTPLSGDYGIDLIIEHEFGKIGVQLKCYFDKVPLKAVQEVVAGLNHYGLSSGMVITNSYFQPSAKRLANDNKITLWDRDILIEKLEA